MLKPNFTARNIALQYVRGRVVPTLPRRLRAQAAFRDKPIGLLAGVGKGFVYVEAGKIFDGETLRKGARAWARAFKDAGLAVGDRIVLSERPGPAFLSVLAAAFRQRLTLAVVPAGADLEMELERFDARAAVGAGTVAAVWTPGLDGGPPAANPAVRRPIGPPTADARLILATSGTTGLSRQVVLSDRNLQAVLSAHLPHLKMERTRVLSILPWTHAFGLIIDLLPSLVSGAVVVRDPDGGREARATAELITSQRITHVSAVPITYRRLADHAGDDSLLRGLGGGVVGGAPVTPSLAELFSATRLRVGYGLTEASPGLSLGGPGIWAPYFLGRPLGCEVRVTEENCLQFRGPNACLGFWAERRLHRLDPSRWVDTGDYVDIRQDGLFYLGRSDDRFKLDNGRWIEAAACEQRLRCILPAIDESIVYSPDGRNLALAWSSDRAEPLPPLAQLQAALGPPGALLRSAVRIPESIWSRTPKGAIDRRATVRGLMNRLNAAEEDFS